MARPNTSGKPSPPKTIEEAVERGLLNVDDIPEDREDDPVVSQKIDFAVKALERKREALDEVGAVRELLTLLIQTGSGSREQVKWIRFHLPRKGSMKETGESDELSEASDEAEQTAEQTATA